MTSHFLSAISPPKFFQGLLGDLRRYEYLRFKRCGTSFMNIHLFLHFNLSLLPNFIYRISLALHLKGFRYLSLFLSRLNLFFFGIEISPSCIIAPGLFLPHPQGVILGAIYIGKNATIFQHVTVGSKEVVFDYLPHSRPFISDNVTLGCGSIVLGGIYIGCNSVVSANSLVTVDVPDNTIAKGSPCFLKTILRLD